MQSFQEESEIAQKKTKTKQQYSRNVKKLKYKLQKVQDQIQSLQQRIDAYSNTSNDQIISMKIVKFCKQRNFTPEMIFRFADTKYKKTISRTDFKNTITSLGVKLSQHELTRLQYLLDQDISGEISWDQYNNYLYAFNMKKQFNPNDQFMKNALGKLDLNKILEIGNNDKDKNKRGTYRNLLNYEEFLKYCHKNLPGLTNKQLASIFNKLKKNQLIDLEDLINYLQNLEQQKRRIEKKNEQKKIKQQKKQPSKILMQEEQQQVININSLQGIIRALLKYHLANQRTFHSSEFQRLQKLYNKDRNSLVSLFKRIDKKLKGSIGFNQLICFYAEEQKKSHKLLLFVFQLMGKKLLSQNQKPQAFVQTYSQEKVFIEEKNFYKMCQFQFELNEQLSKILYGIALQQKENTQKKVLVKVLINLMNVTSTFKLIIRPSLWNTFAKDFYYKDKITILTDGFATLRLCDSIADQIRAIKQIKEWSDFQFGPSFQDEFGHDSINMHLPSNQVKWIRASKLGMKDFYIQHKNFGKKSYNSSSLCSHEFLNKSLQLILKQDQNFISYPQKNVIKTNKSVEQSQLNKLFDGLHPLVFHDFQQWGIYVIKFYVKAKWVYVITDDKIPCDKDNEPLFSSAIGRNCSYICIVQKAYAKLKGSYDKLFNSTSFSKYIYELSSMLPSDYKLQNFAKSSQNDIQWKYISSQLAHKYQFLIKQKDENKNLKKNFIKAYLINQVAKDRTAKVDDKSGIQKNLHIDAISPFEIKDETSNNSHKSHRLVIINSSYVLNKEKKWNPFWNRTDQYTKFKKFSVPLLKEIKDWNQKNTSYAININDQQNIILNYKLIRSMFNTMLVVRNVIFDQMIILRKIVEFQKDFKCSYMVKSTQPDKKSTRLTILFNKLKGSQDSIIKISIKTMATKSSPQSITSLSTLRGQFNCISLQIPSQQNQIDIWADNFNSQNEYAYQLTFYFENPRYSLKERDRQILFRYVSEYQEREKLDFGRLQVKLKQYFYQRYFKNAGRKGILCC